MIIDIINNFKQHPFVSEKVNFQIFTYPFEHIVIQNLFKDNIYQSLCYNFHKFMEKTPKLGKIGTTDISYDAKIYSMKEEDCQNGYEFFASPFWKDFVSFLFKIRFNQHIAYSLHYHEANTVDGHSHLDLGMCSAINDQSKRIKLTGDCLYTDDTKYRQPHTQKIMRAVAGLYYFNNNTDGRDENGGGTAIYKNYQRELEKIIKPINNSYFMFKIGPKSYHGFKKSVFPRSAMVQWFHSDIKDFVENTKPEFDKHNLSLKDIIEKWIPQEESYEIY